MSLSETAAEMEKNIYNLTYISYTKTSEPKENSFLIQMFQKAKTNKTTGLG